MRKRAAVVEGVIVVLAYVALVGFAGLVIFINSCKEGFERWP